MDEKGKKKFDSDIQNLEESIYGSALDTESKNLFLSISGLMKTMHADTQTAHMRIDHRKDEMKQMKDSIDSLSKNVDKMADKIGDLTRSQAGIIQMFNKHLESQKANSRRMAIYITVISVISMIGTFGSLKGASIAASIWNVIGKLL